MTRWTLCNFTALAVIEALLVLLGVAQHNVQRIITGSASLVFIYVLGEVTFQKFGGDS